MTKFNLWLILMTHGSNIIFSLIAQLMSGWIYVESEGQAGNLTL